MKTTIVTGLLGSGKTTFIRNQVRSAGEKTIVLVNDFGAAGVDGEIFSAGGIQSVELPSGCVCCSLKFDLITTIRKIVKEFLPEHLVIEPSGVASPTGVLEALESAGISSYSVIGIVDVTEFTDLFASDMYGSFFRDQITFSDIILVNKIDLVHEGKIEEAEKLIESINPRAILFRTRNATLAQPLSASVHGEGKRSGMGLFNKGRNLLFNSPTHFHFETLSFRLSVNTKLSKFAGFFHALAKGQYGHVARAKALISSDSGPFRFDSVYGKVDSVSFEQEILENRLVVIGQGLNRSGIERGLSEGR